MLVKCAGCGSMISDKAKTCPKCGIIASGALTVLCPECKKPIPIEACRSVCPECGFPFQETPPHSTSAQADVIHFKPEKKRISGCFSFFITGTALLLLLSASLAVMIKMNIGGFRSALEEMAQINEFDTEKDADQNKVIAKQIISTILEYAK